VSYDWTTLPADLPVPEDDGAADHLRGARMPPLALPSTAGGEMRVDVVADGFERLVLYAYPRTGRPDEDLLVPEWNEIPGARGCTPESCGFRDHAAELRAFGLTVAGLSAQTLADQLEFAERNHMPFPVIADPELRLRDALRLPTFEIAGHTLYRRLALVARGGVIEKVFYPVFPPDRNAADVVRYLEESAWT
jgi:peroxiredoxin